MAVTLINPFVVAPEHEAAFLKEWIEVAERVKSAPGFIETKLHRSLDPNAHFRFVNVAHWASEQAWRDAFKTMKPGSSSDTHDQAFPALYEVAKAY